MGIKIQIDHTNGKTYSGEVMRIARTSLGAEDHGIFSAWLHCEGSGTGIGVGGYSLDTPIKDPNDKYKFLGREGTAYGLDHIAQLIKVVLGDYGTWEKLVGKNVIVLYEGVSGWGGQAVGLASIDGSRVFILKDHVEEWKSRG